ncbi:NADP oxidoreductase [Chromatium okenii]|uniref:NADH-quinone oxidoreductase subunit B family protein n=1 Tax=Chromatium okenii TaxID=61644 RepID=UPI00190563BD|nr:NADP oxidoreductase [Chromatium okenii]MBK1641387.1 NADP oxidoreductase [Chromatium okenii]
MNTKKITVATAWLDGCSGCHMSFLDLDQQLFDLIAQIDIVYSPLVDAKELPAMVDVGILEGSISSEDDLDKARLFRQHCKLLISLGDCAITGNVPALRNQFKLADVLNRAYYETATVQAQIPTRGVPALRVPVKPIHGEVVVDVFIPGCPPRAGAIGYVLTELLAGRVPDPSSVTRFGA